MINVKPMPNENLKKYVMNKTPNPIGEYSLGDITVYVKEALPDSIDLHKILHFIRSTLPSEFYRNVDMIYIGRFPFLNAKQADAAFQDGAIYLSNQQTNSHDFVSDLIHEIAHSFEEVSQEMIYSDGKIEQEFLAKRATLAEKLKERGFKIDQHNFSDPEFNVGFDRLLYNEIGYASLTPITAGLFISPYAATSLREYFANAFEEFFVNDIAGVKQLAPSVYMKLIDYLDF